MRYPEEYMYDKDDYLVLCGEEVTPCDKKLREFAKKTHVNLNALDPSTKQNLKRIICGDKVKE